VRALDPDVARRCGLAAVGLLSLIAVGWITWPLWPDVAQPSGTISVVHWANGHMAGDDVLLPAFAQRFNAAGYRTAAGNPIRVEQYLVNSGQIYRELLSRLQGKGRIRRDIPEPTLVTPVAEHWLYAVNDALSGMVVETGEGRSFASTWIGIATFKEMAECLGWPNRDLGYDDIIALSSDPAGWGSRQCGRAEWGRQPLITYTDPNSSSTGRSVLFTLYSIAAGKLPEQLTAADVADSRVISYLSRFQAQVAHYVPDTLLLNCEIFGGPTYGHFFPIAEDNLVKLYKGKIVQTDPAAERLFPCGRATGSPIKDDMVMIYPREGAVAHTHPAAGVRADWVTPEQREAAEAWIAFLREDAQQRVFMEQGFRPVTGLPVGCPICPAFGLQTSGPKMRVDPNRIPPAVGERAVAAWGDVKNIGVVVFVIDNSLSMAGAKLQSARDGVIKAIDQMYDRNLVGLVTFSGSVHDRIAPAPVPQNRFPVTDALRRMQPSSGSVLFGAVTEAVEMAARAPVPERAIRGVVVLAGGPASSGAYLSDLVKMASPGGKDVGSCRGFEREAQCGDENGEPVDRAQIKGVRLTAEGGEAIKVYFIGIGMNPADLDVGRILAEATRSNFVGTTADDLATVVGRVQGVFLIMAWRLGLTHPFAVLLVLLGALLAAAVAILPTLEPWLSRASWILPAALAGYIASMLIVARWPPSSPEARRIRATRRQVARRLTEQSRVASGEARTELQRLTRAALARIDEEIVPPFLGLVGHNIDLKHQLATYGASLPAPDAASLQRLRDIYAHRRAATDHCVQQAVDAETRLAALLQEPDEGALAAQLEVWTEGLQDLTIELARALILPSLPTSSQSPDGLDALDYEDDEAPTPIEEEPQLAPEPDAGFVELVDQALKHLNKPTHLAKSGLAAWLPRSIRAIRGQWSQTQPGEATSLERAQALRQLLVDAIERLKHADSDSSTRALQYHILHKKYVLEQEVKHIVIRHDISESTFFRERVLAVRAVADNLWQQERRSAVPPTRDPVAIDYLG